MLIICAYLGGLFGFLARVDQCDFVFGFGGLEFTGFISFSKSPKQSMVKIQQSEAANVQSFVFFA